MAFEHPDFSQHEHVQFCSDRATGLHAIIAIHNTNLGPAAGGCRMCPYGSMDEALADALRLSRAMTYKNAIAGLHLGGGKSVIIGDPKTDKTPELLRAFGRQVERLGGYYFTAEDVGIGEDDIRHVASSTSYAIGTPLGQEGVGDPSPYTADGVFKCMERAVFRAFGSDDLVGRTAAIQGLGSVGWRLGELYHKAGFKIVVADVDHVKVRRAAELWNAEVETPDRIHAAKVDIFSPCALGGAIHEGNVGNISARIVVGAANNQLDHEQRAADLMNAGIVYVPDFVANGGGIIHVASEVVDGTHEWVIDSIDKLADTADRILEEAARTRRTTVDIANQIAESRFQSTSCCLTQPQKLSA